VFPGGPAVFAGATSETRAGWTIGAGIEWGFAHNWSVKAEYLYYDLGDTTVIGLSPAFPASSNVTNFENDGHIARVGVNYRFGYGAPVVARY
jgi:outer membrane immunogenic protein